MAPSQIAKSRKPAADTDLAVVSVRVPTQQPTALSPPRPSLRPSARLQGPLPETVASDQDSAHTPQDDSVFVIDYSAPGCVIGHVRNMTFSAWDTPPTAPHVEAFIALAERLSTIYPLNSNVTIVMRNAGLPGAEARVALEQLTAQYARSIHSVSLVIDGGGFWASMIRSFLTGLHVLRGNGYRCKAFATPAEAYPWLLPSHNSDTGVHLTEQEMKDACDAVFARMKSEASP
jgi:hypothetical protein